jgi:hypothetical protein
MGSKPSKPGGLNVGKLAFMKRRKRRLSQEFAETANSDVGDTSIIDGVAAEAAESLEMQNDIQESSNLSAMGAVFDAVKKHVSANPLWKLWCQIQRSKELKAKGKAGRVLANKSSDIAITGGACLSLWLAKKVSIICAPGLSLINALAKMFGLGPKLLVLSDFTVKGHKYFGIGVKEEFALIFGCLIAVALYLFLWRFVKLAIRLGKKVVSFI